MLEETAEVLAEFLSDPVELVYLASASELVSSITDRLDAMGVNTKIRTEPRAPLTRVYLLEDNGNVRAQGRGRTRLEAYTAAVLQFAEREKEKAA